MDYGLISLPLYPEQSHRKYIYYNIVLQMAQAYF